MGPNASLPASPLRPPTTAQVSPPNAVRPALDQATGAVVPASATERAYEFAPESPLRPGVQNRRPATQTGTVREAPPARIQRAVYQQQPGGALALPPNDLESNRVLPPAGNPQLPEAPAVDPQAPRIPGADAFIPRDTPPAAPFGEPQQPRQVAPNDPPAVEPRVPSPSDLRGRGSMSNPFRTDDTPPATEPELNNAAPRPIPQQPNADVGPSDTELPAPARSKLSCDVLRDAVRNRTIDKISLDISPPFRPDIINRPEEKERLRKSFLQQQKSRVWRDLNGQAIGEGSLSISSTMTS